MIVPLSVTSESGKRIAVLTPKEKNMIYEHLNPVYRMRSNVLLYTGMRIAEAKYFVNHPEWFRKENAAIFIPIVKGLGKERCKTRQRVVILNKRGIDAVESFFTHRVGFAAYQNMESALRLAAQKADFDTKCISTKMFRKTAVSWLLTVYPNQQSQIARSMGHDARTMDEHYLATGWRKTDRDDMAVEFGGWGEQ
jgi:integrase